MTLLDNPANINERAFSMERGFTLVEAMISMLVTVVGLVSLAGMFTVAMKTNASSRNFTTATTFA
ncbi:MAG TPA: prepilin-type N-terminal cleavage/methylation domain-containing protein, partial [Blastocatellia bacterium]|nr:prepilin-type N-terminal cleavage/methylation domain-containing protein [Blastocatellia bacterium]